MYSQIVRQIERVIEIEFRDEIVHYLSFKMKCYLFYSNLQSINHLWVLLLQMQLSCFIVFYLTIQQLFYEMCILRLVIFIYFLLSFFYRHRYNG